MAFGQRLALWTEVLTDHMELIAGYGLLSVGTSILPLRAPPVFATPSPFGRTVGGVRYASPTLAAGALWE